MQLLVFILLVEGEIAAARVVNRAERCLSIALIYCVPIPSVSSGNHIKKFS